MSMSKMDPALTSTGDVIDPMLSGKNWNKFEKGAKEYLLRYRLLGPAVDKGVAPTFRRPQKDDLFLKSSLSGIKRIRSSEEEVTRQAHEKLSLEENISMETIEAAEEIIAQGRRQEEDPQVAPEVLACVEKLRELYSLWTPAYEGECAAQLLLEDIKRYDRDIEQYENERRHFLAVLLRSLPSEHKSKLEAMSSYAKAREEHDVLHIWHLLEIKFGSKGVFAKAILALRLFRLRQGDKQLAAHINEFKKLVEDLGDKRPDKWLETVLFIASIKTDPYIETIRRILTTEPLPDIDAVIKQLEEQNNADGVIGESNAGMSMKSLRARERRSEESVPVNRTDMIDTGKPAVECNNCNKKGHTSKDCPAPKAACTVKGCSHPHNHCSAAHERVQRYYAKLKEKRGKKSAEKKANKSTVNFIDIDEDEIVHLCKVIELIPSVAEKIESSKLATTCDEDEIVLFKDVDEEMDTKELVKSNVEVDSKAQCIGKSLDDDFFFAFEYDYVPKYDVECSEMIGNDFDPVVNKFVEPCDGAMFALEDYSDKMATDYVNTVIPEYAEEVEANREQLVMIATTTKENDNILIGDSGSTATLVRDHAYIYDQKDIRGNKYVVGIDGGRAKITKEGKLAGFEEVDIRAAVFPEASGNILSLSQCADAGCHGVFNKDELIIYKPDGDILATMPRQPNGLWGMELTEPERTMYGRVQGIDRTFSRDQIERARKARIMHAARGHISTQQFCRQLDEAAIPNVMLTSQDVRNADIIFGPCGACTAKLNMPPATESMYAPPENPGDVVSGDWVPYGCKTMGGNTGMLFTCDQRTSYLWMVSCPSKHANQIFNGMYKLINHYNSFQNRISKIVTDTESSLIATKHMIGQFGVLLLTTIPQHHNKFIERHVQTCRKLMKVILTSLPYMLPDFLIGELWFYVIQSRNLCVPDGERRTALEMFEKRKPDAKRIAFVEFGQPCQVALYRGPDREKEMHYAILVGWHPSTPNAVRAYVKLIHKIVTRLFHNSEVVLFDNIPTFWGFTMREKHSIFGPRSDPEVASVTQPQPVLPIENPEVRLLEDHTPVPIQNRVEQPTLNAPVQQVGPALPETAEESKDADNLMDELQQEVVEVRAPVQISESDDDEEAPPGSQIMNQLESEENQDVVETEVDINQQKRASEIYDIENNERFEVEQSQDDDSEEIEEGEEEVVEHHNRGNFLRIPRTIWDEVARQRNELSVYGVWNEHQNVCFSMSVKQAINGPRAADAQKALIKEVENMSVNNAWEICSYESIPEDSRKDVINALTLMTEKFAKGTGEYVSSKCRTVINGKNMPDGTVGETATKMINTAIVFMLMKIGLLRKATVKKYDVTGAFLSTVRNYEGRNLRKLYVKLNPAFSRAWLQKHPEHEKFLHNGCLYGLILRNIYGLPDAGYEFGEYLARLIMSCGYKRSDYDDCLYYKMEGQRYSWVLTWVDDILVIGNYNFEEIEKVLKNNFSGYTMEDGDVIDYVGVSYIRDRDSKCMYLSQRGLIQKLMNKYKISVIRKIRSPGNHNLFTKDVPDSPECNRTEFLSLIMSMMYIARMTRPDILFPITYLATKSVKPTEADYAKAMHVLKYLVYSRNKVMKFSESTGRGSAMLVSTIEADASYALHKDMRGHTGLQQYIDGDLVWFSSAKQEVVTLSTLESECYACVAGIQQATFTANLFNELRLKLRLPFVVYQDNMSNIAAMENGHSFKRGKHIMIRKSYIKEKIDSDFIEARYRSTNDMGSDWQTKLLPPATFEMNVEKFLVDLPSKFCTDDSV